MLFGSIICRGEGGGLVRFCFFEEFIEFFSIVFSLCGIEGWEKVFYKGFG